MSNLHRAQIYIAVEQMQQLKLEAQKDSLTISELVRRAIDRFLGARAKNIDWGKDPLTRVIGKVKLSVSDASTHHDHYLYG